MPFDPVPRRRVSDVVFEELRAAVLTGRYAPQAALPSERVLAESFAVNRHAIREALGRLQQSGLVEVHHGGATRVLDWRATGGLDLLAHVPYAGEHAGGPEVLRSIVEARRSIGTDVARLAATRATGEQIAELRARAAAGGELAGDLEALSIRYEELWRTLVAAAGNLAYVLAYNSLLTAGHAAPAESFAVFASEADDLPAHAALVEAVAGGAPDKAADLADALLSRSLAAVRELV
jgi:GntR family transcriptional repressor for pyruvate dehydrogenase complex